MTDNLYLRTVSKLNQRHVTLFRLANSVYELQNKRIENLQMDECFNAVTKVLSYKSVQNNIFVGIDIDTRVENGMCDPVLSAMIKNDESLFSVDEEIAIAIASPFGEMAITNYGRLDIVKNGLIKELDQDGDHVNVFLDDIVAAIIASAATILANEHLDYRKNVYKAIKQIV